MRVCLAALAAVGYVGGGLSHAALALTVGIAAWLAALLVARWWFGAASNTNDAS